MKSEKIILYFIVLYNILSSIFLFLDNNNKIDIDKFWLNFIYLLMLIWNILLIFKLLKNEKNS